MMHGPVREISRHTHTWHWLSVHRATNFSPLLTIELCYPKFLPHDARRSCLCEGNQEYYISSWLIHKSNER